MIWNNKTSDFVREVEKEIGTWKRELENALLLTVYSTEKLTIQKGKIRNTITVKFDKDGRAIGTDIQNEYIPTENELKINELKEKLAGALHMKDYRKAADLQDQIKALETN